MARKLAVILGAGASFDSVPSTDEPFTVDWTWRPPLTSEIFAPMPASQYATPQGRRANFGDILEHYPKANSLVPEIQREVGKNKNLEEVLRGLRDDEPFIRKQYQEIPFYLQELLAKVSDRFVRRTSTPNLDSLVRRLHRSGIDRVAYITTNYDTLLEMSLVHAVGGRDEDRRSLGLDWYVQGDAKWLYLKLHGSVNWFWPMDLPEYEPQHGSHPEVVLPIMAKFLVSDLNRNPVVCLPNNDSPGATSKQLYYPALAVPVDDNYESISPESHLEATRAFLADCENFLVIGHRGKDYDLLELLSKNVKACRTLGIVADKHGAASETYSNLSPALKWRNTLPEEYPNGFSSFISSGGLEEFVAHLARRDTEG